MSSRFAARFEVAMLWALMLAASAFCLAVVVGAL